MGDASLLNSYLPEGVSHVTPKAIAAKSRLFSVQTPPSYLSSQSKHLSALSPDIYSSPSGGASQYSERKGRLEVSARFPPACPDFALDETPLGVDPLPEIAFAQPQSSLKGSYKFMFQKLPDIARILSENIVFLSEKMVEQDCASVDDAVPFRSVQQPCMDEIRVRGSICTEGGGKLNAHSILLQGCQPASLGGAVELDVGSLTQYSLFPGQVVVCDGSNQSGKKFMANKLLCGSLPPTVSINEKCKGGSFGFVIAAGPFTTPDSASFEPLDDLIAYVVKHEPSCLILLGPFVDRKLEFVEKGTLGVSYEELFLDVLDRKIVSQLDGISTKVVLVASSRDVFHTGVYPTAPYAPKGLKPLRNVFLAPDPCVLSLGGINFALTATDVIAHLSTEEISLIPPDGTSTDRIARLVNHLFLQRSFYPLYPPSEEHLVDIDQFDRCGSLELLPHVLVCPSVLNPFLKDVNGVLVVNPRLLVRGVAGGTFAQLTCELPKNGMARTSVVDCVSARIVRI